MAVFAEPMVRIRFPSRRESHALHRALADQVADHHQPGGRCRRGLRASFVSYARHAEKNSSLSNWIDGFLASAAREWLATRKGDE
jgi:hypothetical protein